MIAPDAMTTCNTCEAEPMQPDSPAGQCAACEAEARAEAQPTSRPVAAISVFGTRAKADEVARLMYGWPGDSTTTTELAPGLWHVTLNRPIRAAADD